MAGMPGPETTRDIGRGWGALVAASTALVVVALALLPFLTPAWVRFEQSRTDVKALTGLTPAQLDVVAARLLGDLVLWQGDFGVAVDGAPLLNVREVAHLRDVRGVLWGGLALAIGGGMLIGLSFRRSQTAGRRAALWRAVGAGSWAATIGVLVIGAFVVLAFPVFFELFHRLFFSAGTYTFDPATERLVQLFPTRFWSDTTVAIGGVVLGLSILGIWIAGRRASAAAAQVEIREPDWAPGSARAAGTRGSR